MYKSERVTEVQMGYAVVDPHGVFEIIRGPMGLNFCRAVFSRT